MEALQLFRQLSFAHFSVVVIQRLRHNQCGARAGSDPAMRIFLQRRCSALHANRKRACFPFLYCAMLTVGCSLCGSALCICVCQCPYPLNSGHLSAFWVSHPILPHLHVLMWHEDGNVYEDTRRSQSQSPHEAAAGTTTPRRSSLLTGTTGIAAVPLPPIRAAAACFSSNRSNGAALSPFPAAAAAAAVSATTAGANSNTSTRVSASSTVLAALQSETQQQQSLHQCAVAPAPSTVHAVSVLPPPFQLPPVPLPAVAAEQSPDSSHACGLSSPSLSLPQSDGWGDPDLLQLSVPDASSADDANMQLMIAEMQERKQMEELDQQGLLWEG
jgi:hypothetical protein